ncbi:MAG: hypothetical protein E6J34_22235 [Chloroflexi bacterium]|nr:MAG: hypothetical protein E6J34_22235 [Chloroflexota bacterium]
MPFDGPIPRQMFIETNLLEEVIAQQMLDYEGDALLIALTMSGGLYISLPGICSALGLNTRGQLQRIQRTEALLPGLCQLSLKTRGGTQRLNCLHIDILIPWLTGLQRRGMSAEEESKLEHYIAALSQALQQAFFTAQTPLPVSLPISLPDQMFLPFLAEEPAEPEAATFIKETPTRQEQAETTAQRAVPQDQTSEAAVAELLMAAEQQEPETHPPLTKELTPEESQQELRALLTSIPYINSATTLATTSYQEDRAIREATLARKAAWEEEPDFRRMRYIASNQLYVYVGDPEFPLSIAEALQRIRALGESTILTARLLLGLWNIRRTEQQLTKDGSAVIRVDEILEWRGVQKHSRTYSGSEKRFTDGYQWKHKQQVHQDIKLLEQCYLRGQHTINVRGRSRRFLIDGPYLRVTSVKETTQIEEGEPVGYFVAPGAWINTYEEYGHVFFAEIDRRIFQLHPHNDQIALRIALYLTEYWRQLTRTGSYEQPIIMQDLLHSSMVTVDEKHLTSRFAPRVEAAIQRLVEQGIIGEARLLTPIPQNKAQWGKEWLQAKWCMLPPLDLMQRYQHSASELVTTPPLSLKEKPTRGRKKRT